MYAEGNILTDEREIHDIVTKYFNKWFAIPEFSQTSMLHMSQTWNTLVETEESFLDAEMRATFASPPTVEEFTHAIANLPTNSAAGPTGLTYNMMMGWSPKVEEAAHSER